MQQLQKPLKCDVIKRPKMQIARLVQIVVFSGTHYLNATFDKSRHDPRAHNSQPSQIKTFPHRLSVLSLATSTSLDDTPVDSGDHKARNSCSVGTSPIRRPNGDHLLTIDRDLNRVSAKRFGYVQSQVVNWLLRACQLFSSSYLFLPEIEQQYELL